MALSAVDMAVGGSANNLGDGSPQAGTAGLSDEMALLMIALDRKAAQHENTQYEKFSALFTSQLAASNAALEVKLSPFDVPCKRTCFAPEKEQRPLEIMQR